MNPLDLNHIPKQSIDLEAAIQAEHNEYARSCTISSRKQPKLVQIVSNSNGTNDYDWSYINNNENTLTFKHYDLRNDKSKNTYSGTCTGSSNSGMSSGIIPVNSLTRSQTTPTFSPDKPAILLKCTPSPLYTARLAHKRPSKLSPVTDQNTPLHREKAIQLPDNNIYDNNHGLINNDLIDYDATNTPLMSSLDVVQHSNDNTTHDKHRNNSIQTTASVWSSNNSIDCMNDTLQRTNSTSSVWSTVCSQNNNSNAHRQSSNTSSTHSNDTSNDTRNNINRIASQLKYESDQLNNCTSTNKLHHSLSDRRNNSSCRLSEMQLNDINSDTMNDMDDNDIRFDVDMNSDSPRITQFGSVWGSTTNLPNMSN